MFKLIIFSILSFALFKQQIQQTASIAVIKNVSMKSNQDETTESTLNCFRKYLAFHFKEMNRVRFNLINERFLRGSRFEQTFLQESNGRCHTNPLKLTTLAGVHMTKKNYLIFLSSNDFVNLKSVAMPKVHEDSFLYIFYEQTDASIPLSDIYSIFTPTFEQNIVLTTSSTRKSSTEWTAFRVVLLKCPNSKQYKLVKVGQCLKSDNFKAFPLKPINTASCSIQVATINNPPFAYYDPSRGLYSGIEYHFLRLVSNRWRVPIKFDYINYTVDSLIMRELFMPNSSSDLKSSAYLGQVGRRLTHFILPKY